MSSAAAKAIDELQAQNAHLRECFQGQAGKKRGLLKLDASRFGAAEKENSSGSPKAGGYSKNNLDNLTTLFADAKQALANANTCTNKLQEMAENADDAEDGGE